MPIYEYLCGKCGHKFEKLILEQNAEVLCPKCGSKKAEKQFSSFSSGSGKEEKSPACPKGGCCPGCSLH